MSAKVMGDAIWARNEKTDPAFTKPITGKAFKGTSTNATYIVKRLTQEFGPCGLRWGVKVLKEELLQGAPILKFTDKGDRLDYGHEIIHHVMIEFWYQLPDESVASFNAFGNTPFVFWNKNGIQTDDEASKKSLTDALLKAASWLGFAGDIHLGLFDDDKYIGDRRKEEADDSVVRAQAKIGSGNQVERAQRIITNGQPSHPELNGDSIPVLDDDSFGVRVHSVMNALSAAPDSEALTKVERRTRPLMLELEHAKSHWLEKLIVHMASVREKLPAQPAWTLEDMPEP